MKIVEEKPISAVEAREILERREKERKEEAPVEKAEEVVSEGETASGAVAETAGEEVVAEKVEKSYLGYEQKITLEHLRKFSTVPKADADKAKAELEALGVKDYQIVMILDVLPETKDELLVVLQKERMDLSDANVAKILEITQRLKSMRKK